MLVQLNSLLLLVFWHPSAASSIVLSSSVSVASSYFTSDLRVNYLRSVPRMCAEPPEDEINDATTYKRKNGKLQPRKPKDNRDKLLFEVVEVNLSPLHPNMPHKERLMSPTLRRSLRRQRSLECSGLSLRWHAVI